jgi:CheY-like chemotaxis protein
MAIFQQGYCRRPPFRCQNTSPWTQAVTVRESIAEYLTQKGYTVLKANGGPAALGLVARFEHKIDLMLTDMIMPQMSGRDLADKIRASRPGVKTVFMSGYLDNLLSNQQILDPRYMLLQKPVRLIVLAKCLREMLGGSKGVGAGN